MRPVGPVSPVGPVGAVSEVKRDRALIGREPHVQRGAGGDRTRRLRARFARHQGGRNVCRGARRTRRRASVRLGGFLKKGPRPRGGSPPTARPPPPSPS